MLQIRTPARWPDLWIRRRHANRLPSYFLSPFFSLFACLFTSKILHSLHFSAYSIFCRSCPSDRPCLFCISLPTIIPSYPCGFSPAKPPSRNGLLASIMQVSKPCATPIRPDAPPAFQLHYPLVAFLHRPAPSFILPLNPACPRLYLTPLYWLKLRSL